MTGAYPGEAIRFADDGWVPELAFMVDNFTTGIEWRAGGMTLTGSTSVPVSIGTRMLELGMPADVRYCKLTGSGALLGLRWAAYLVSGEGDYQDGRLDLWRIEVRHPEVPGASLIYLVRPSETSAMLGIENATAKQIGLLEAGRYVIGQARRLPIGRPPGSTTITDDEQVCPVIRRMLTNYVRPTYKNLAVRTGFSVAEIRGYLRATGRTKADLIALCRMRPPVGSGHANDTDPGPTRRGNPPPTSRTR